MRANLATRSAILLLAVAAACAGCSSSEPQIGYAGPNRFAPSLGAGPADQGLVKGFLGGVAADEPIAALAARNALLQGGNAADAAVAAGLAMTVTYPSRASLGGGGACIAFNPARNATPEAIIFPAPAATGGGDRPAAVPMMARGLYLLSARYGLVPFETLVNPAEMLARTGVAASRAFVQDLNVVAGPLRGDPVSAAIFLPNGQPLKEGQLLVQTDLATTLANMRTSGVGDFYQGNLSQTLADAAQSAGGGITRGDLRAALPQLVAPLSLPLSGGDIAYFTPTDGGLATSLALKTLLANPAATDAAGQIGLGAAARLRGQGGDPAAILANPGQPGAALPALPASAGVTVVDKDGAAVTCAFTMNNLFGTGRIAGRTGILLAASPRTHPPALLAGAMVSNPNLKAFRAATSGTGQSAAPLAAAFALASTLSTGQPMASLVPEPGRADVVACARYLPGKESSCNWAVDPRGAGLATGSN